MDATWGVVLMFTSEEPCCTGCRIVHPRDRRWDVYLPVPAPPRWPRVTLGGVHFSSLSGLTVNPSVPGGKPHGR